MSVNVVVSCQDLKTTVDVINVALSHIMQGIVQPKTMKLTYERRKQELRDLDDSDDEGVHWIEEENVVIETYPNNYHVYVDTCASAD